MSLLEREVTLHTGEVVPLASFVADGPVALVFLRHFGCPFCKEQVAKLKEPAADLNLVYVVMAHPERADEFRRLSGVEQTMICDADLELHERFGVPRGNTVQMANPRVMRRAIGAMFNGHRVGVPVGDPRMLSAEYVIDQEGKIRWSHIAEDISDLAPPEVIREKLLQAK